MSDSVAPTAAPAAAPPRPDAVASLVAELRAGVRQRQAERTALVAHHRAPGGASVASPQLELQLADLRSREFVQEPVAFSPRAGLGGLIVLARKAFFKLFMKWYLHPMLQGQNAFNQATSRLLQQLVAEQESLRQELEALRSAPRR